MATARHALPSPEQLGDGRSVQIWMPSKHMGNLLVSLRAIAALVDYYGPERCTLVIDESYRELVPAAPLGADVIYFPRKPIYASAIPGQLAKTLAFIRSTRRPKPEIAVAIEGDGVSRKFMAFSGCKIAVGPSIAGKPVFPESIPLDHGQRHVFYDYEAVARHITGNPLIPGYPPLRAEHRDQQALQRMLANEAGIHGPYAILHPCATKDYKQWPLQYFAEIADYIHRRGYRVLVTGAGDVDGLIIAQLLAETSAPLVSLHNKLSLGQLIALLSNAQLFLGNDTGPTHLAAACGTPTLALFGPTDDKLWGPLGDNATILRSPIPCEPECLRRRCGVEYRCMRTLNVDLVMGHIEGLL